MTPLIVSAFQNTINITTAKLKTFSDIAQKPLVKGYGMTMVIVKRNQLDCRQETGSKMQFPVSFC